MVARIASFFFVLLIGSILGAGGIFATSIAMQKKSSPANIARIAERFEARIFVAKVKIGETEAEFIVDTGASSVSISPELAKKLALPVLSERDAIGVGGVVHTRVIRIPEMRIGS